MTTLPAEILEVIFWQASQPDGAFDLWCIENCIPRSYLSSSSIGPESTSAEGDRCQSLNPYVCIELSRVCRLWRAIILNQSAFWSRITISSLHWATTLLSRSKSRPLKVAYSASALNVSAWTEGEEYPGMPAFAKVLEELPRIQSLQIFLPLHDIRAQMPVVLFRAAEAPLLERMKIWNMTGQNDVAMLWNSPRLRQYEERRGFEISWATPLQILKSKPPLTHLVLAASRAANHLGRPQSQQILPLLSDLPLLEHLHLQLSPLETTSTSPAMHGSPIDLSNLRYLYLQGSVDACAHLLAGITYPISGSRLTVVSCSVPSYLARDPPPRTDCLTALAELHSSEAHRIRSAHDRSMATLSLHVNNNFHADTLQILGWRSLRTPERFPRDLESLRKMAPLLLAPDDVDVCIALPFMLESIPASFIPFSLRTVQVLCLIRPSYNLVKSFSSAWHRVLGLLDEVHTLLVEGVGVDILYHVLFDLPHFEDDHFGRVRKTFPKLENVRLYEVGFTAWDPRTYLGSRSCKIIPSEAYSKI